MKPSANRPVLRQIVWTLIFLAAAAAVVVSFLAIFDPTPYEAPVPFARDYDRGAMQAALAPAAVRETLGAIEALGSRAPGQPGLEATRDLLARRYRGGGLECLEHELDVAYPLAETLRLEADGTALAIGIWPAPPNFVQPGVTPPGGLAGELMLVTEANVRDATAFTNKIAVVDLARPLFKELALNPAQYCDLGFQAMIVTHAGGLGQIPWSQLHSLRLTMPLNYVRLVAAPEILDYVGKPIRLEVRSAYRNEQVHNLLGVLRAPGGGARRAVLIGASYDAASMLPDLAHGSAFALQLALQLRLLEGLQPHRDNLQRDILFLATSGDSMAHAGLDTLLAAAGMVGESAGIRTRLEAEQRRHTTAVQTLDRIEALLEDPRFASEAAASGAALDAADGATREFFAEQLRYVLRRRVFHAAEELLQAQIQFERHPDRLDAPEYHAFRAAKTRHDLLNNQAALPLNRYLERRDDDGFDLRQVLQERFGELRAFHETSLRRTRQELAINALLGRYDELLVISPALFPSDKLPEGGRETLSFSGGAGILHGQTALAFHRLLQDSAFALGLQDRLAISFSGISQGWAISANLAGMVVYAQPWSTLSYPAFSVVNPQHTYTDYLAPVPLATFTNLESIAVSMQVLGEAVLSTAHGYGSFPRLVRSFSNCYALRGAVYASGVGNAVVPNYPMAGALLTAKEPTAYAYQRKPVFFTDPYGCYEKAQLTMPGRGSNWLPLEGAYFGADGLISYFKDSGMAAQNIYKSREMAYDGMPVNLILYRSRAVAILNRINPQSMRSFTDTEFIRIRGLAPFASTAKFTYGDAFLEFINPRERFFVTLKAGSPDNPQVAVTRAFCLGTRDPAFVPNPENEIDGPGYLAQDTPVLREIGAEAAHSMRFLADKRVSLQARYGMVDEMTAAFHDRSGQMLASADAPGRPMLARLRDFRQAMAYLILNHPVIRGAISEAIWGILWYMGLLVPFIFFFEKLVFGFTDIRKQLAAQGVIFLVVFALLRLLHPAFQMIRSSVMILLGFVIILISSGITLVLSSKFKENIDALQRMQGAVKGAEVNKAGIMMTAFMLGLNNMHKRKVRTGLTCATLVLMTFVMICFTSVQSRVVNKERALGKAPYQGLLVREKRFLPISSGEISALESRYGERFTVNERQAQVGFYNIWQSKMNVPSFEVVHGAPPAMSRFVAKSALLFRATEPLRREIRMLTTNGWFTAAQAWQTQAPYPVLLPDTMADKLGLTVAEVDAGGATVKINGVAFVVQGIFSAESLQNTRDIDGDTLLPFDSEALIRPQVSDNNLLAEVDDPRVVAEQVIIGLVGRFNASTDGVMRTVSAAVCMDQTGFAAARAEVAGYLEQTGRDVNYGLDGTAYNGRRARSRSLAGMADLLIPLIIAALTVLNTMKGSVYERRDEIFVYNAVGIAPRYIFFMFVAEALVYSVVGALLGYILSQGTGRVLTALGWTGGLNMNFTSISTVYASLAIAAATLASTYFPARSAMEIAKPTDNAGWTLPSPTDDDELAFDLPFTFTHFDRIAVLGFFHQYFVNHGEGSAGPFFAADPVLAVSDRRDPLAGGGYIPVIEVQVWLKPFDLGVSQRILIELATDPDTREYISRMRLIRVTGTREAWLRLNGPLVARIRRHFLHWRAVPNDMKQDLHGRARRLLEAQVAKKELSHGQS